MPSHIKTINVLGVTGSIGQSVRDVILANRDRFDVSVVCAQSRVEELADSAKALEAKVAIIEDKNKYETLRILLEGTHTKALCGEESLIAALSNPVDITVAGIAGMAGLKSLRACIPVSRAVAIANKEPLVAAGALVMDLARAHGTQLLPVDSEHNAIFQVFDVERRGDIEEIVLTASGGPFLKADIDEMRTATPEQALRHPNWVMGAKISIDSATMMNKALEVIEAYHLFDLPPEKIRVMVHPQSVVHGMVAYKDGSVLTQMGASDMRTPIARILDFPNRLNTPGQRLDLKSFSALEFMPIDETRFPVVSLAYTRLERGAYACIALNAANELAVENFLSKRIGFLDIMSLVKEIVFQTTPYTIRSFEDVFSLDLQIREDTQRKIDSMTDNDQPQRAAKR